MAKSKKPRKKYQGNRWNSLALMRPKELEDSIKNIFRRCETVVHMKIGYGEMTEDDIQCLRDVLNFATTLVFAGKAIDREVFLREFGKDLEEFQKAFHTYYGRFIDKGTVTATGDELRAIRAGVSIAGQLIEAELNAEMFWCLKCFLWMKDKTRSPKGGRIQVDFDHVEKQIDLYGRKGWGGPTKGENK